MTLDDGHYPPRRKSPERSPRPASALERAVLAEALGLAALAGRFEEGNLSSIISIRCEPLRRISEDHSLQPGTAAWARLGEVDQ